MQPALAVLILPLLASADFTPDFHDWIKNTYGEDVVRQLERKDLGPGGSFGGRAHVGERLKHHPVVFVHGVSDTAGQLMRKDADHFIANGYSWSELYATTYFNGAQGNPLKWTEYSMKCEYVKQVRALIIAVRLYTGRAVDVIGFSLGVPVSRKAILGGVCVDTGEFLGGSLTRIVDTYVGVAGPNHGAAPQVGGVGIAGCALTVPTICNDVNGLWSGAICPRMSRYLTDINSYGAYEGRNIYTIYSTGDQIVGYLVCGQPTSRIDYQTGEKVFTNGLKHDDVFLTTFENQLRMVRDHVVI